MIENKARKYSGIPLIDFRKERGGNLTCTDGANKMLEQKLFAPYFINVASRKKPSICVIFRYLTFRKGQDKDRPLPSSAQ